MQKHALLEIFFRSNRNFLPLTHHIPAIIFIFKFSCWSSIRICLCLKPYFFISRL